MTHKWALESWVSQCPWFFTHCSIHRIICVLTQSLVVCHTRFLMKCCLRWLSFIYFLFKNTNSLKQELWQWEWCRLLTRSLWIVRSLMAVDKTLLGSDGCQQILRSDMPKLSPAMTTCLSEIGNIQQACVCINRPGGLLWALQRWPIQWLHADVAFDKFGIGIGTTDVNI